MQDAYAVEKNELGTWLQIGYKSPAGESGASTTNFTYTSTGASDWTATSKVKLNDCAKGSYWTVTAELTNASEGDGAVTYTPSSDDETNCIEPLTPSFNTIGAVFSGT